MALTKASFWPDEADCAETWRKVRWPDGVRCVECGSQDVTCRTQNYRGHLCRYRCNACGKWFSDLTGTELAHTKVSLAQWFYLMRELDKGRPVLPIADEIDVTYKTAHRMAQIVRRSLYLRQLRTRQPLQGEVEGDDIHLKGGQQGRRVTHRAPRRRGLRQRGRGTYAGDRPLVILWAARHGPQRVLEMRREASKRSVLRSALRHIAPGSRVDTDKWRGYALLDLLYDHRTVNHSQAYVTAEGVHCNTAEAEWSIFRPWWAQFRGVAKRHFHLYLAQYSFRRTRREATFLERLEEMAQGLALLLRRLICPSAAIPLPSTG